MYNHQEIEQKWQKFWKDYNTFRTPQKSEKPKFYALDMFPYPSGAGLHVGHPEGYTANDIVARYKHAQGYNVLHPMGWDAFGLPAENYAIKTGIHPRITTAENIATFKSQIQHLGFSYDWSREIDTTDPKYFQWTQWIFLKLFEAGLAYEQDLPINYCPSCKTGLANEEVLSDFTCERCGTKVEKRKIRQWVLAITKYAERLLADVDDLDWPEGIKDMQRNWIGKSEGCEFEMKRANPHPTSPESGEEQTAATSSLNQGGIEERGVASIRVYTTRVDTVFGMTYAVIAPDHPSVEDFITDEYKAACEQYILKASQQSDQDRTADDKEKTGVFTGSYVINPYNGESVPLWIADYVLGNYGTGAVMAVPAHDERDFAFAKKYGLEIKNVIEPSEGSKRSGLGYGNLGHEYKINPSSPSELDNNLHLYKAFKNNQITFIGKYSGTLINCGDYDGISDEQAREIFASFAEKNGFGHKKINYKLRDWLFSRQRYWGEPIPLIHLETSDVEKLPRISSLEEVINPELAYILTQPSSQPSPLEEKEPATSEVKNAASLSFKGERIQVGGMQSGESFLVINGKIFSKIYDGIYGKIVCDYRLPLELPQVEAYEPAGDGQSPLAKVPEFVHVQLAENLSGKRETNTMPQWGGSCWYYLRFMDAKNPEELVSKTAESYWGSVDSYVGGAEHAVLHLLYARFWHKFLYDIGVVSTKEPFHRLRNQGMILAYAYERQNGGLVAVDLVEEKNGKFYEISTGEEVRRVVAKMSKSLKNVVNPDDIVKQFGADTLRLYEMYMGDFADTKPWDTTAIVGCRRFLEKVYRAFEIKGGYKIDDFDTESQFQSDEESLKMLHKSIKKIEKDIENYKFNTAIAQLMILIKHIPNIKGKDGIWFDFRRNFLILLHPFAPHMAEELWSQEREFKKEYGEVKEQEFSKIYFATGNSAKIERLQKLVSSIDANMKIEAYSELIDVEETGKTALECALQKLAAYEGKKLDAPILTADTSVHFEGQNFEPTRVRRAAIEKAGKKESELSRDEIGLLMRDFYQDIARNAGGKIPFHYTDAFAILYPDGRKKTYEYTRPYYLTDTVFGELNPNIPMRCLYISQITGKTAYNTTDEDYEKEFAAQKDMALELFELGKNSIFFADWPSYDEALTVDSELTIGVQVLGKLRGEIHVGVDEAQDSVLAKAKANPDVAKWLEGKEIVKEIYVPGKIVNIVVK